MLLSVAQAAGQLNLSAWTLRDWIKQRRLPIVHVGRRVFIEEQTIHAIIAAGRQAPLPLRQRRFRERGRLRRFRQEPMQ